MSYKLKNKKTTTAGFVCGSDDASHLRLALWAPALFVGEDDVTCFHGGGGLFLGTSVTTKAVQRNCGCVTLEAHIKAMTAA